MELSLRSDARGEPSWADAGGIRRNGRAIDPVPTIRGKRAPAREGATASRASRVQTLLTEVLLADRQLKGSLRTLARAVYTAQAEGIVGAIFEQAPSVLTLLRELQCGRLRPEYGNFIQPSADIDLWIRELSTKRESQNESQGTTAAELTTGTLTRKELKVLDLLARGNSNIGMAQQLFVSESTVRTHLRSINYKLRAGSRTQAIAIARDLGLVA